MKNRHKIIRSIIWMLTISFILINALAIFHSYKFTHFDTPNIEKTKDSKKLSNLEKIKTLLLGVNNPRPTNNTFPNQDYERIKLKSNKEIECWSINANDSTRGTVIIFHGYGGNKSSMLDKSDIFLNLGFNTLIVDFMGSGDSEGNQTTIGYFESEEVKTCFDYLTKKGEKNIYLYGTSMGSVAIMKAINDFKISPKGIIIECPFGSMYQTICAKFKIMKLPTFPLAGILTFWGGIQNGFWAFEHNPINYAKNITCPTLLMYGEKDEKVSKIEIKKIFNNLKGKKDLKIYPNAGHENYLSKYKDIWTRDVNEFLTQK